MESFSPTASPSLKSVDLLELAAAALASAITASRPIRKLAQQAVGDISQNARMKLDGTVVTDADGAAQQIIVGALAEVSNDIRIVGEESTWDVDNSHTRRLNFAHENSEERELENKVFQLAKAEVLKRYSESVTEAESEGGEIVSSGNDVSDTDTAEAPAAKSLADAIHESQPEARGKECCVDPSRVSVFVDPLDGTTCYAKGEYGAVTILVAIIVGNDPVFGVICKPFGHEGEESILDSGCFAVFGGTLINGAFVAGGGECVRSRVHKQRTFHMGQTEEQHSMGSDSRAIISRSRSGGVVRKCIDALSSRGMLHPDPVLVSGAGAKTLCLISGTMNETLWFFPKPGTSLWDVAAADALLRVIGGRLSDKNANDLDYSKSRHEAENNEGIVACCDARLHAACIRLYQEEQWDDTEQ